MARATKYRDQSHARIYGAWRALPAWQTLSLAGRCLLLEMLLEFRPGTNGMLAWSCRKAARPLGVGKSTAAPALIDLEMRGWIRVEKVAGFDHKTQPVFYSLAMFSNDATNEPASRAFQHWKES